LATVVGTQQLFNMNSVFDPDRTGTGHQPYGYDQMASLYNRYRVLRFNYRVDFGPAAANYWVSIVPVNGLLSSSISNQTTFEASCEVPRAKSCIVSGAGVTITMSGMIELNQFNGVTKTEYIADDRFESPIGSSPAELMVLYLGFYNPQLASLTPSYIVTLEYYCDWHDPIIVGQSFYKLLRDEDEKGKVPSYSSSGTNQLVTSTSRELAPKSNVPSNEYQQEQIYLTKLFQLARELKPTGQPTPVTRQE